MKTIEIKYEQANQAYFHVFQILFMYTFQFFNISYIYLTGCGSNK